MVDIDVDRTFEFLPVVLELVEAAENPERVSKLVRRLLAHLSKNSVDKYIFSFDQFLQVFLLYESEANNRKTESFI